MLAKLMLSLVLVFHSLLPGVCASVCVELGCAPVVLDCSAGDIGCGPVLTGTCCAPAPDQGEPCCPGSDDCPAHCCEVPEATPPSKDAGVVPTGDTPANVPVAYELDWSESAHTSAIASRDVRPPDSARHSAQSRLCVWLI